MPASIAIVNRGWTRGDEFADLKVEGDVGTILTQVICDPTDSSGWPSIEDGQTHRCGDHCRHRGHRAKANVTLRAIGANTGAHAPVIN
jgi:hypothetical protein